MDILILGNGFDLAHDLPTKYSDFLEYCRTNEKCKEFLFNNIWIKHFLNKELPGDKWIDLEDEIYNVIVKLSELPFFKDKVSYEKYNNYAFILSRENMSFNFDNIRECIKIDRTIALKPRFFIPIKDFIQFLYDQLRNFTKEFNNYLKEKVEKRIENCLKYDLCLNSECISLLNFNYTYTCEKLYKLEFNIENSWVKTQAIYIHGKICDNDDCDLILGTKSFSNEKIPIEFNVFKKHHQRHKYATIEAYQEFVKELENPEKDFLVTFHIIGHSLDKADHNLLKHILKARKVNAINIYYHTEEAQNRMMNNIDLIIGENEVMSKVRFIKQNDPKRGVLIPIKEE